MLHSLKVHIVDAFKLLWQMGQLEIMSGKQGIGFYLAGEVLGHRPGQCQAIVGAGSTADFIHQDQ